MHYYKITLVHIFNDYYLFVRSILERIIIISRSIIIDGAVLYFAFISRGLSLAGYYRILRLVCFMDALFFKRYYAWALMFRNTRNSPASWNLMNHPGSNFTLSLVLTSLIAVLERSLSSTHPSCTCM